MDNNIREKKKCKHLKVSEFKNKNYKVDAVWSCESWECEYEPVEEEQTGEHEEVGHYGKIKPRTLNECKAEDCISRQSVLDLAKKGILISNDNYKSVCKAINELPNVYPKSDKSVLEDIKAEFEEYQYTNKYEEAIKDDMEGWMLAVDAIKIVDNHINRKEQ